MIGPLANPVYGPFVTFLIISFIASGIITVVYKFLTNQNLMKKLKDEIKKCQEDMRSTKDTTKLLEVQKKVMDVNMKYMMESFKPTFVTFIPIIFLFWWMSSNVAFAQLLPNEEFDVKIIFSEGINGTISVNAPKELVLLSENPQTINQTLDLKVKKAIPMATFKFKGDFGDYIVRFDYEKRSYEKLIVVSNNWDYALPELKKGNDIVNFFSFRREQSLPSDGPIEYIRVGNKPVHPLGESLSIFGWTPGWIAAYIVFSLVFSLALRKAFNLS